jgi:hypothetical protein
VDKIKTLSVARLHSVEKRKLNDNDDDFFIIYVPSQQLHDQLQTQHSVDTSNYFMEQYNIKSKTNYRQAHYCRNGNKQIKTKEVMIIIIIIIIII